LRFLENAATALRNSRDAKRKWIAANQVLLAIKYLRVASGIYVNGQAVSFSKVSANAAAVNPLPQCAGSRQIFMVGAKKLSPNQAKPENIFKRIAPGAILLNSCHMHQLA
jgi:hypothetical protein